MGLIDFFWKWSDLVRSKIDKPIRIVASRNGLLYEVRETDCLRVSVPRPSVPELDLVPEGITWKLPKIPGTLLAQTIAFFQHFATLKKEALVYITWNRVTRTYTLHCPRQRVNAVTVEARFGELPQDEEIVTIIHSHHEMEAVFSKVDDRNDQALCVYGVLGGFGTGRVEHRFRAGFNGRHFDVPVWDLFEIAAVESVHSFPEEWLTRVHDLK